MLCGAVFYVQKHNDIYEYDKCTNNMCYFDSPYVETFLENDFITLVCTKSVHVHDC